MKRFGEKPINKALDNATKNSNLPLVTGGSTADLRKVKKAAGMQVNSHQPEGQLVEDNKFKTRGGASDRIDIEFEGGLKQTIIPGKTKITGPGAVRKPTGAARYKFGVDKTGLKGPEKPLEEGKKDACYKKVKARYDVWPSAYASGALVKCRKVGAANWGNKTKKEGYEFSNWRDDFQATEYESVNIIETEPLQPTQSSIDEKAQKCWKGYEKKGTKKMFGKTYNNCVKKEEKEPRWQDSDGDGKWYEPGEDVAVPKKKKRKTRKEQFSNWRAELSEASPTGYNKGERYTGKAGAMSPEEIKKANEGSAERIRKTIKLANSYELNGELIEDWQKVNKGDKTDGMSQKAVDAYRRENPGSKLKTAVTEKNPGGKRAKRRKSFCARSNGQRKMHNIDCSKTPDKAICKARKRWRC